MNKWIVRTITTASGLLRIGMFLLASACLPVYAQTLPGDTPPSAVPFAGGAASAPCADSSAFGCNSENAANGTQHAMAQSKPALPPLPAAAASASEPSALPAPDDTASPEQQSEFQQFVSTSLGKPLPLYGHNLFMGAPDSFSPLDNVPVTADYLVGPGDELQVRGWGQVDFNLAVTVDRNGAIYLPKVGNVSVAGVRFGELQAHLKKALSRSFRNFDLNVSLGKLRSIQVFVVGQAKQPGAYTVSSLSTLINTVFASGGPSLKGSLRQIQLKRNDNMVSELDLYDFLLKGDKSKDVALLPGDVIYFPPVGPLAAIAGSINNPAIYELKANQTTLAELIWLAGGLTSTANGDKVRVERIDQRRMRKTEELTLDAIGQQALLKDGDVVQVQTISGQFDNAVTLRGNVANPGRYPWQTGMRIKDLLPDMDALIVPEYWAQQNRNFKMEIGSEQRLRRELMRNENEINWDYALVERLNKSDMSTALHPFNLGKALSGSDVDNNLLLMPGDVVTIFSKDDIQVPAAKRSVYVRLEGEFNQAGVYKVQPGETLRQLVQRAGGLTENAYLFASEFKRVSVRESQQKKMEEILDRMSQDIERNVALKSESAISKEDLVAARTQAEGQRALLDRLRKTRASGRIVLDMLQNQMQSQDIPDIVLEDGDQFSVPSRASTVNVMGMVYNENAFLYKPGKQVADYLQQAGGPTHSADESRIYVLRADGTVQSSEAANSLFGSIGGLTLMPGDAVIVPEQLDETTFTGELKDWAQIFYQFALGVGAIHLLKL